VTSLTKAIANWRNEPRKSYTDALNQFFSEACGQTFDYDQLDALTDDEREYLFRVFAKWKHTNFETTPAEHRQLIDIDYKHDFPDVKQFIEDDYYMGTEGAEMFPYWKDAFYECMGPGATVAQIIATGPIGSGKTTFCLFCFLYKMCWVTCMRDPQDFLGIMGSHEIVYGIYSVTKDNTSLAPYHRAISMLKASPFFRDKLVLKIDAEYKSQVLWLPGNIFMRAGSKELHALSLNLFGVLIEEANFRIEKEPVKAAYGILNASERRIQSRYMQAGGYIPGITIINSSKKSETDFLEKHIDNVRGDPTVRIYDDPIYKVKGLWPGMERTCRNQVEYCGETFRVSLGNHIREPKILADGEEPPEGVEVENVPIEYMSQYQKDIDGCLKDISGRASRSRNKFFPRTEPLLSCIDASKNEGIVNPMTRESITMTVRSPEEIYDFVDFNRLFIMRKSKWQPTREPQAVRYAHCDYSKNTNATGVAIGHISRLQLIVGKDRDLQDIRVSLPVIEIDLAFKLISNGVDPIDYQKVRNFFLWLRKNGMVIEQITFDQYQSQDTINILNKEGFNAKEASVERNKQPYYLWKNAVIEDRFRMFSMKSFIDEAILLMDLAKKVDHPADGSKDLCDAVVGVCRNAILDKKTGVIDTEPRGIARDMPAKRATLLGKEKDSWAYADYRAGESIHYFEDQSQ